MKGYTVRVETCPAVRTPPKKLLHTMSVSQLPPYTKLSLETQERFLKLPQNGMIQAEYVWIGGKGELRCKTKTLMKAPASIADLPIWNFDGSSTEQAPGSDSEVLLKPAAIYKDPFRPYGDNILVLCSCYKPDPDGPLGLGSAIPTNTREACEAIMSAVKGKEPWFGIEQEYTLFEPDMKTPFGWCGAHFACTQWPRGACLWHTPRVLAPRTTPCSLRTRRGGGCIQRSAVLICRRPQGGFPDRPQGPYYCSIGTENAYGRAVCEAHYKCCMYAGINISGINGEVMCPPTPFTHLIAMPTLACAVVHALKALLRAAQPPACR